jgi:hypothetical protein
MEANMKNQEVNYYCSKKALLFENSNADNNTTKKERKSINYSILALVVVAAITLSVIHPITNNKSSNTFISQETISHLI